MARKKEPGIAYYGMQADHTQHRKIRLLFNDYKADGYWIWSCILDNIYKIKGYYYNPSDTDDLDILAADICKMPVDLVIEVINCCVKRGLFDADIYEKYGVLTSDRIQTIYLDATQERRRKGTKIEMIKEYCLVLEELNTTPYFQQISLISLEESNNSTEQLSNSTEVPRNNPQSKVKKSKVKKSKVDKSIITESGDSQKHSLEEQAKFKLFTDWILKYAPMVAKMEEPITIDQYVKLKQKNISKDVIQEYLIKMHNWRPLLKKNRSAYLTLLNWNRMQKDREGNQGTNGEEKTMVM